MLLPDSNIWIQLIKGKNPIMKARWRNVAAEDIVVCSIVTGNVKEFRRVPGLLVEDWTQGDPP